MAEITTSEDKAPAKESKIIKIVLGVLAVFTYFFGLTIPFLGPDEARYAQVAREMFERDDWVTPTLGGFNWFEKPALLYWLEIASYHIFGVNEFAARFGPAIFGLGTVLSLYILAKCIDRQVTNNTGKPERSNFAFLAALVTASTLGIMAFAHGASFDIIVTFPLTASLVSFYIWHEKNESEKSVGRPVVSTPLFLFYVFIGVALLAKGLIGAVFPLAIVSLYYLLLRKLPSRTFIVSLVWGGVAAIAVAGIWYLPMYLTHGYGFIDDFFVQHHFQRFTSNKYQHPQPFYFFFLILPLMTLPWLPIFGVSLWTFIRSLIRRETVSPILFFSISWLLVPLVFFSFSGSKLPGYILPAVPAAIIFVVIYIKRLASDRPVWNTGAQLVALSVFIGTIMIQITVMPWFAPTDSVKTLVAAANASGYTSEHIAAFYSVSHNAEFYAPGRLIRDETGKQRAYYNVDQIAELSRSEKTKRVLVLVKLKDIHKLTAPDVLLIETIADNTEYAIVAASAK